MDSLLKNNLWLDQLMPLIREQLGSGKSVTLSPKGTSMMPMLRQGLDTVTISPLPEKLAKFDLPLYRRDNGQYVLHRIVKTGDTLTCIGDNQFQLEHGVRQDQMIGIVTAFSRNGHIYRVTDIRYIVYCWVWHYSRTVRRIWQIVKSWLRRMLK